MYARRVRLAGEGEDNVVFSIEGRSNYLELAAETSASLSILTVTFPFASFQAAMVF